MPIEKLERGAPLPFEWRYKINEIIDKINELEQKIGGNKEILEVVKETMLELMDTDVATRHKFGCREDHSLDRIGGWKDV